MPDQRGGEGQKPAAKIPSETAAASSLRQAGAVHDINQMLAVIMGRAELLLMREGTDSRREDLEAIVLITGLGQEELLARVDPDIVDQTATKPLEWSRLNEILDMGSGLNRRRRMAEAE